MGVINSRRLALVGAIATAALVVVLAVTLLWPTRKDDSEDIRAGIAAVLSIERQAKSWSAEITRVRADPLAAFDTLAVFLPQMERLKNTLLVTIRGIRDLPDRLANDVSAYIGATDAAIDSREEELERFKLGYAMVRNSARYLPELASIIARTPNVDPALSRDVLAVTKMVTDNLEVPTATARWRIGVNLGRLGVRSEKLPKALLARVGNFIDHAVVLLEHQERTEDMFSPISSVETVILSDRLVRDFQNELVRKEEEAVVFYRNGLLIAGCILLALCATFAVFMSRFAIASPTADASRGGGAIGATPIKILTSHRILVEVVARTLAEAAGTIIESVDSLRVVRNYARSAGTIRTDATANIRSRGMEIIDMAERLASFTKGPDNPSYSQLDINDCIDEVIRATNAETVASVTLESHGVPPLFASRLDIFLMLEKVVENSVQAIREANKEGEIKVSTVGERDQITITVIDNGSGMTGTAQERMYQPFYSAKGDRPGVGLPTTNYLVAKYGGSMSISSGPGDGTVVRIVLPGMASTEGEADPSRQGLESDVSPRSIALRLTGVLRQTRLRKIALASRVRLRTLRKATGGNKTPNS